MKIAICDDEIYFAGKLREIAGNSDAISGRTAY